MKKNLSRSHSYLMIGLGLTGFSVVGYLVKKGMHVTVADSRDIPPYLNLLKDRYPHVQVITGKIPYEHFYKYDQIIVSPGISIQRDIPVIGDIELFSREATAPVIGITGSNGKSTVTMLVSKMLETAGLSVQTGGNIGIPALDLLNFNTPNFYVLELSSFQLDSTESLQAESVTILNISPDHMDRYPSFMAYRNSKLRILSNTLKMVINRHEPSTAYLIKDRNIYSSSFGLNRPPSNTDFGISGFGDHRVLVYGSKTIARVSDIRTLGLHNVSNILAAMALIVSVGVELSDRVIQTAINYLGLPHRCELVRKRDDVTWINDSKGTNVGATLSAINSIEGELILLLGGQSKNADFRPLAAGFRHKVKHVIVFGEDAFQVKAAVQYATNVSHVNTLMEAVALADSLTLPGQSVLFSPACASFDMFENYEIRGNLFKSLVQNLDDG